jgi:hypothetical protein
MRLLHVCQIGKKELEITRSWGRIASRRLLRHAVPVPKRLKATTTTEFEPSMLKCDGHGKEMRYSRRGGLVGIRETKPSYE